MLNGAWQSNLHLSLARQGLVADDDSLGAMPSARALEEARPLLTSPAVPVVDAPKGNGADASGKDSAKGGLLDRPGARRILEGIVVGGLETARGAGDGPPVYDNTRCSWLCCWEEFK